MFSCKKKLFNLYSCLRSYHVNVSVQNTTIHTVFLWTENENIYYFLNKELQFYVEIYFTSFIQQIFINAIVSHVSEICENLCARRLKINSLSRNMLTKI